MPKQPTNNNCGQFYRGRYAIRTKNKHTGLIVLAIHKEQENINPPLPFLGHRPATLADCPRALIGAQQETVRKQPT